MRWREKFDGGVRSKNVGLLLSASQNFFTQPLKISKFPITSSGNFTKQVFRNLKNKVFEI